jgi:HK97 gp10 family phage protein
MAQNAWIEVDFKGLDGAIRQIQKIKSDVETELEVIMLQAAFILEAEIRKQIINMGLVDTGTLKTSVHSFVRSKFGFVDGVAGTNMEYAPFLEYGTGHRGAESGHPYKPVWYKYGDSPGIQAYKFMHTAWENTKYKIIAYVKREIRKLVSFDVEFTTGFRI